MTEKELRKLRRHDLLELLVEQSREAARLNAALREREEELKEALEGSGRLKDKLNEKDGLIEKLKARLDEKDAEMAERAADREEQLNRLKEKLDEKDATIDKLRGQVDRMDEKTGKLETEIERLRSDRWKEMKESGLPSELIERLKALI